MHAHVGSNIFESQTGAIVDPVSRNMSMTKGFREAGKHKFHVQFFPTVAA